MSWGDAGAPVAALGQASVATLALHVGGALRVVVAVKATFVLAPDAPMVRTKADPLLRADQHRSTRPDSSLTAASEIVPYRPRADVLLYGHARPPRDTTTPAIGVRLMVARGQEVVLDKRLAVRGAPDPTGRTREPSPFAAMELAWELAAFSPENPAGLREGPRAWPHIIDPRHRDRPAGFGPISPRWPPRSRLVPDERAFAAPIPALPADFPWAYFNAAPEDQRIDFLRGDEWIGFEGMSSQLPRVQSCLPGVRGAARVYGPTPDLAGGQPLALQADTLTLDAERLRCSVVWRGSFPVAAGHDMAALRIFAGVASAAEPLTFPSSYGQLLTDPRAAPSPASPRPAPRAPSPPPAEETVDLPPADRGRPDPGATMAFDIAVFSGPVTPFGPSSGSRRPIPQNLPAATPFEQASPVHGAPAPTAAPFDAGATMDTSAVLAGAALPFQAPAASTPPPRAPVPPPRPSAPRADGTTTMDVSALLAGPALPFQGGPASPAFSEPRAPLGPPLDGGATINLSAGLAPPVLPFHPAAPPAPAIPMGPPAAPAGPLFPEVARPAAPFPSPPGVVAPAPATELLTLDGEPPKTLGGFFLAAMARAS